MKRSIPLLFILFTFAAKGGVILGDEHLLSDARSGIDSAGGNRETMVCWTEGPRSQVRAARLNASGEPIGALIDVAPTTGYQSYPRIAFDGLHFLIICIELSSQPAGSGTLSGRLLNLDGSPAGDVITVSQSVLLQQFGAPITGTFAPALFWNGTRYVVIWDKSDRTLGAVSLTPDGRIDRDVVLPVLSGTTPYASTFSAATNSQGVTLLTWLWTDPLYVSINAAIL